MAVLCIAGFNLFWHLGDLFLQDYDESRHATSAHEMLQSGKYITTTYLNYPDYYNLKPVLGFWSIVVSYKVFGVSIFALRFPSALFAFLTIAMVMLFAKRYYNKTVSVISGLILSTTYNYLIYHGARTGDFDSLFVFLLFCSIFAFAEFIDRKKDIWLYISGFALSMGFLVKSFAIIQVLVIFLFFVIITGSYKECGLKRIIGFFAVLLIPIFIWAIARYNQPDGRIFFKSMVFTDLLNRASQTLEYNGGEWWYYINILYENFKYWLLVVIGLIAAMNSKIIKFKDKISYYLKLDIRGAKKITLLTMVSVLTVVILFSTAQTKLQWYINLAYPFCAVLLGMLFCGVIKSKNNRFARFGICIIAFFVVFIINEIKFLAVVKKNLSRLKTYQSFILDYVKEGSMVYKLGNVDVSQSDVFLINSLKGANWSVVKSAEEFIKLGRKNDLLLVQGSDTVISGRMEKRLIKKNGYGALFGFEETGNDKY
jgi:4-amino-4-deoxy-L-arabinose transferase-like glycosyltransferase